MDWTVYTIVVRESFEAFLIIALINTSLKNSQQFKLKLAVWLGVLAGLIGSIGFAYLIQNLSDFLSEQVLNLLEVGFPLLTALLIFYVVWWMQFKSKNHSQEIKQQILLSEKNKKMTALFMVSFLAISREGFETVLFLSGSLIKGPVHLDFIKSILLAILTTLFIYLIIQKISYKIRYRLFFNLTSILLVIIALKILTDTYQQIMTRGWI